MYERLQLMRELLSDQGSIYLHCDWHKSHQLRFLLDEVFGAEHFRNEIIWDKGFRGTENQGMFQRTHETVFWYSKTKDWIWNQIFEEYSDQKMGRYNQTDEEAREAVDRVRHQSRSDTGGAQTPCGCRRGATQRAKERAPRGYPLVPRQQLRLPARGGVARGRDTEVWHRGNADRRLFRRPARRPAGEVRPHEPPHRKARCRGGAPRDEAAGERPAPCRARRKGRGSRT